MKVMLLPAVCIRATLELSTPPSGADFRVARRIGMNACISAAKCAS